MDQEINQEEIPLPPFEKTIVLKDDNTSTIQFGPITKDDIETIKKNLETMDMLSNMTFDDNFKNNNLYIDPVDYTSWINIKIDNNKTDDVMFVMKLPPKSSYTIVSNNNPKKENKIKPIPSNNLNKLHIIIILLLMVIAYLYFNRK